MATQYILSIDQGTTGTTVSLINTKGQQKVKVNKEFRQIFPKPGWVEHNPQDIWRSTLATIRAAITKGRVKPENILAIGITNQRETVMAWNRETGEPLGNAIVWQCRRTTEACEKLKKRGIETRVKEVTGLVLDPYFSGTKMQWILKNNPEAKKLARKGQLCFGTVDCFLIWKLTGGKTFATDVSNASRTLLMDLDKANYSDEMLHLFQLKRNMLPEIKPSGGLFGKTLKVPGLGSGIPITGAIGDQQSALFGQLCFDMGESKMTYGTGSFLLMNTGKRKILSKNGLLTTVAWQLPGQSTPNYALEGGAFICGAAVQWLRDNLGIIKESSEIEKLAKKAKDTGGVQFIPAFAGLGAPFWDPHVRGTMFGLTRGSGKEHMARATLEAMALQNVDIVSTMGKDARVRLKSVRVDGGAARNNLLMQMQSDYLGVNVVRPKVIETTAMGAAFMAGFGAGVWSSLKELKKLDQVDKEFKPVWAKRQRDERVAQWHKAIKA
ncbi:MAG: glycerol kinase GlpK, partial [Bdellovibrionales bacterium]|nr:glycerol kinase GlpK [Bdellovibrionales bacterium]